jgi:hypothetical protein
MNVPTEVTYYDPTRAYNGVTVFATSTSGINMIDMDGRLIRHWTSHSPNTWGGVGKLEDNGNISINTTPTVTPTGYLNYAGAGACGQIEEIAWDTSTWALQFYAWNANFRQHHDLVKIFNKKLNAWTWLCVGWGHKTNAQASAAGATRLPGADFYPDAIWEFLPTGGTSASVVWRWSFSEHLCQSVNPSLSTNPVTDPAGGSYVYNHYVSNVFLTPQKFDANTVSSTRNGPISDWQHLNSLSYNADLGYVVFNSREYNEFYVVDHDGTFVDTSNYQNNYDAAASSAGDFVYRFGSPRNYNAPNFMIGSASYSNQPGFATNGSVQIWGAHGINFIPDVFYTDGATPPNPVGPSMAAVGAGHLIEFNNNYTNDNPQASGTMIIEINPYVYNYNGTFQTNSTYTWQHNASYVNALNAGTGALGNGYIHQSSQVVWRYRPKSPSGLCSAHISYTQRLPNGNTLIDAAETSHMLEVTVGSTDPSEAQDGTPPQVVWEYTFPSSSTQANVKNNGGLTGGSTTFRSYRYDINHPVLTNHLQMAPSTYVISLKAGEYQQTGYGKTLTGRTPCRSIPCQY